MEKNKREINGRFDISYESYIDYYDYKDALSHSKSERDLYKSIPIGEVSLDLSKLPEDTTPYIELIKNSIDKSIDIKNGWSEIIRKGRYNSLMGIINRNNTNNKSKDSISHLPVRDFLNNKRLIAELRKGFKLPLYAKECGLAFVTIGNKAFAFPESFVLEHKNFEDEKLLLENQTKDIDENTDNAPALLFNQLSEIKKQEELIEAEIFDIENFHSPELNTLYQEFESMKNELESKVSEMLTIQSKMKAEMQQKIDKMKKKLFVAETDYYGLLCRWGETVSFDRIAKGKKAPVNQPLVIQQKTVYLSEDLPRLRHLINDESETINELFQTSPKFLDYITPNDKSITFIKEQRKDGYYKSTDDSVLSFIHDIYPSSVGILVRDGENIYLGWTDSWKIQIGEDSFMSNSSQEQAAESLDDVMKTNVMVSRYFLFNIVLGLINSSKALVAIPTAIDTVKQLMNNPYIIFSNVDNQITSSIYPSLSDYMKVVNKMTRQDDKIYVWSKLKDGLYNGFNGRDIERSKGEGKRTENAFVNKGVTTIKSVEYNGKGEKRLYVPSKQSYSWSDKEISPNFLIYSNEFLNLSYLTTSMVDEWIMTKNIGKLHVGKASLNFDFVVRGLSDIADWLQKRNKERQLLVPSTHYNENLIVAFTLIKKVKEFNAYQAKRYVKWVDTLTKNEKEFYSKLENLTNDMDKHFLPHTPKRYFVGYQHPKYPYFFAALEFVEDKRNLFGKKIGQKRELNYTKLTDTKTNNIYYFREVISNITTFAYEKKANELADELNAIPFDQYSFQSSLRDKEGKVIFPYFNAEGNTLIEKPEWKVYNYNQLEKILYDNNEAFYKLKDEKGVLWEELKKLES